MVYFTQRLFIYLSTNSPLQLNIHIKAHVAFISNHLNHPYYSNLSFRQNNANFCDKTFRTQLLYSSTGNGYEKDDITHGTSQISYEVAAKRGEYLLYHLRFPACFTLRTYEQIYSNEEFMHLWGMIQSQMNVYQVCDIVKQMHTTHFRLCIGVMNQRKTNQPSTGIL